MKRPWQHLRSISGPCMLAIAVLAVAGAEPASAGLFGGLRYSRFAPRLELRTGTFPDGSLELTLDEHSELGLLVGMEQALPDACLRIGGEATTSDVSPLDYSRVALFMEGRVYAMDQVGLGLRFTTGFALYHYRDDWHRVAPSEDFVYRFNAEGRKPYSSIALVGSLGLPLRATGYDARLLVEPGVEIGVFHTNELLARGERRPTSYGGETETVDMEIHLPTPKFLLSLTLLVGDSGGD